MTERTPALQAMLDEMKEKFGISDAVETAAGHEYMCRCTSCLDYWVDVGHEPDAVGGLSADGFGPFTAEEIAARMKERGIPVPAYVQEVLDYGTERSDDESAAW